MSGINKVIVSFPLATSEFITKGGARTEQTEWHNIVMWRSLAEAAHKVLKKGKLIYIEGKLHTRSFDDKAGVKKYATEIIVDNFTMLGRNSDFDHEEVLNTNPGHEEL
jgi:single-strand DNA-binding protein